MSETSTAAAVEATDLRHLTGCPQEGEPVGNRIERFDLDDENGKPVEVTRCQECGSQVVHRYSVGGRA